MAPPPQAAGTGNTPLHICRGGPHSLCGQSKPVVPDNHLVHLHFIKSNVCKQLSLPFYMQRYLCGVITSSSGWLMFDVTWLVQVLVCSRALMPNVHMVQHLQATNAKA